MKTRNFLLCIAALTSARASEITVANGGKLIVKSQVTTSGGGLVVQSGGQLQIDGTVNGAVTVDHGGVLDVGSDAIVAAQLNGNLTLNGTLNVQAQSSAGTPTCDHLSGITNLSLAGTLNLQLSGDSLTAGQSLDLWDAVSTTGTAPALTGSSLPEGLFSHTWSLVESGTLWVGLAAETYEQWATTYSAGGATEDLNGDGTPNLLEYALAINPSGGGNSLPVFDLQQSDTGSSVSLSFDLPVPCPPELVYTVEVSDDLTTWQTISQSTANSDWTGPATVISSDANNGFQHFQISDDPSTSEHRFIRLRVD